MSENHLARVMREKPSTRFKDKYTGQIFTVNELNIGFLKPTIVLGIEAVQELTEWFERFEKIVEDEVKHEIFRI